MKLYCFPDGDYKRSQIEKFIKSCNAEEQVDFFDVIEQLEKDGGQGLNIKTWKGKIKEIYFKNDNRLIFVKKSNAIFLLYAFHKQKNKTEGYYRKNILKRAKMLDKKLMIKDT